jgi:hypothetical protein
MINALKKSAYAARSASEAARLRLQTAKAREASVQVLLISAANA